MSIHDISLLPSTVFLCKVKNTVLGTWLIQYYTTALNVAHEISEWLLLGIIPREVL